MSGEVTVERVRTAAGVVRQLFDEGYLSRHLVLNEVAIYEVADRLEREQAEKAKRDKRVEELARELHDVSFPSRTSMDPYFAPLWEQAASALLDRYPSLLDEDGGR
jgi:hypothetical protein